ncbi:MAG: hypothetical protein JNJ54_34825 [Myxococcaceae bacterium]|nr:hypothetical protein [Myxococcaceae bacterium]
MKTVNPDLSLLEGAVSPTVLTAMRAAAAQLDRLGVRHWLVGGLAVGAHGFPRATKDVDFFVGDEAFEHHAGGLVTMKPGVPIQVAGVIVDHLSAQAGEEFLTVDLPAPGNSLAVAPIEVLIYLKLKSPRLKDRADVVELLKAGADLPRCRAWLERNAPSMVASLDDAAATAASEE